MTLSEMTAEVLRRLRETSDGTEVMWRDTDVEYALNEAYAEISDATEWCEKFQTIQLLAEQSYYDARTLLREGFLVAGPAFNTTTNRWLEMVTTKQLDLGDGRWEQRLTEPERMIVRGLWWLRYWPTSTSLGTIKQYYIALPDALDDDEDSPGFHESFHYGLVEFALCDLHLQDAEYSLAMDAWQEYLSYESALRAYVQGRASIPMNHGWGESR